MFSYFLALKCCKTPETKCSRDLHKTQISHGRIDQGECPLHQILNLHSIKSHRSRCQEAPTWKTLDTGKALPTFNAYAIPRNTMVLYKKSKMRFLCNRPTTPARTELDGSTPGTAQRPIRACNTKTSTTRNSTNMGSIEAALAAIESLKPGEKLVYTQIAREYDVEPTTLAHRHKGASTSCSLEAQSCQALHPQQELVLLRYIERLTKQGLPPTWLIALSSDILKCSSQNGRRPWTTVATKLIQGASIASTSTSYARRSISITSRRVICTIWMRRASCSEL
jgi:hypothetical protein